MAISTHEHRTTSAPPAPPHTTPTTATTATSATRRPGFVTGTVGLALAALLAVLGTVMRNNAQFAHGEVSRQLAAQRITFKPHDALTDQERQVPCLVAYAGQTLTTGEQAKCYADHFIGAHLANVANGRTFAEMREVQTTLRNQLADAQARRDPSAADLQRQLDEANRQRQSLFEGESNRGLLLTSYGFATLGTKADQAADAAYVAAVLLFLAGGITLLRAGRPRSG